MFFSLTFRKVCVRGWKKGPNGIREQNRSYTLVGALIVWPQYRYLDGVYQQCLHVYFWEYLLRRRLHMIAQIHHKRLHSDASYIIKPVCVCVCNERKQQSVSRTLNLCMLIKQNNNPPAHNSWLFSLIRSDSVHKHCGLNPIGSESRKTHKLNVGMTKCSVLLYLYCPLVRYKNISVSIEPVVHFPYICLIEFICNAELQMSDSVHSHFLWAVKHPQ